MAENFALKDMFNQETVKALADVIGQVHPEFSEVEFLTQVFDQNWDDLELKARTRHITIILGGLLPGDYSRALAILNNALPLLAEGGFEKMVFPDYVEVYGLEDWEVSLAALEEFTKHISGEFAIRPFIDRYPEKTLARMLRWAEHSHPGVRRLASEGCRPLLPWGMRLNALVADPSPILPILEKLKDDPREEIRRSVANNLNDISKNHPQLVIDILRKWGQNSTKNRDRLIKHALRTLIKAGSPEALDLLGYASPPEIEVKNITLNPTKIRLGEEVIFSFEILSRSKKEQALMIDYLVHFQKASGKHAPKVFKLKQIKLQPGEKITISRKHGIKPISTRKYYSGSQFFQPQVNGILYGKVEVQLLT